MNLASVLASPKNQYTANAHSAASTIFGVHPNNEYSFKDFLGELKLKENMMQLKLEINSSWIPKLSFLAFLRGFWAPYMEGKHNVIDIAKGLIQALSDELAVEIPEAIASYFLPSLMGGGLALLFSKLTKQKDFRLVGVPYKQVLSKNVGNYIQVGKKGRETKHLLDTETFHKTVRLKFLAVLLTTLTGVFIEAIGPTLRNLISLKLFNSGSFLDFAGVPINRTAEQKAEQDNFTKERSTAFIKKAFSVFLAAIGGVAALTLFGGRPKGFMNTQHMGKVLNFLDFSQAFELSRSMFALILGTGMWSYLVGARPEIVYDKNGRKSFINPEFKECFARAFCWVIPGALILKDLTTNFLSWLFVGKKLQKEHGVEVLTPVKEMFANNAFFEFKRVNKDRIEKQEAFHKLPKNTQEQVLKKLHNIEHKHVFSTVLGIGMTINLVNFLRTVWMSHNAKSLKEDKAFGGLYASSAGLALSRNSSNQFAFATAA